MGKSSRNFLLLTHLEDESAPILHQAISTEEPPSYTKRDNSSVHVDKEHKIPKLYWGCSPITLQTQK